jgi:hypothetical protein
VCSNVNNGKVVRTIDSSQTKASFTVAWYYIDYLASERRISHGHLVQQHAHGPIIDSFVVTFAQHQLRGKIPDDDRNTHKNVSGVVQ